MKEKTYSITLADGTAIESLSMNGNNFVSKTKITENMFANNLSRVVINDGEADEVHENMELIQIAKYDDGWYFIICDIPESGRREKQMQANIDYLAVMSGIDLEV